jgi:hypothetical protein
MLKLNLIITIKTWHNIFRTENNNLFYGVRLKSFLLRGKSKKILLKVISFIDICRSKFRQSVLLIFLTTFLILLKCFRQQIYFLIIAAYNIEKL